MPTDNEKSRHAWEKHYTRDKSLLAFPDENLVRMLAKIQNTFPDKSAALDFGAGSGRHSLLLKNYGFQVTAADYSENAIQMIQRNYPEVETLLVQESPPYPFPDNHFQIIITWGILHYNTMETAAAIVNEYERILAPSGYILGSIRSERDTYLQSKNNQIHLKDLQGSFIHLYNEVEIRNLFQNSKEFLLGYTERTQPGDLTKKICHWIFQAKY